MLSQLQIRNFAIIDEISVEFEDGLTVITGETGAGKSIMIDAIGLVLGERAQQGLVRAGEDKADIALTFSQLSDSMSEWLQDHDLESEDTCILRRVITHDGRTRCYINGAPTTLASMREASAFLLEISGQNTHQSLLQRPVQRELLDEHADLTAKVRTLGEYYREWRDHEANLRSLLGNSQERKLQIELLEFQLQELQTLAPTPGEADMLHRELSVLSNSQQLLESTATLLARLSDDDDAVDQQLAQLRTVAGAAAEKDPEFADAVELIDSALIQIAEANESIRRRADQISPDPARLTEVESRLSALHDMARKHRSEPDALADIQVSLEQQLHDLIAPLNDPAEVERARDEAMQRYDQLASEISKERRRVANQFSNAVTAELQELGMQGSRFEVVLQPWDKDPRRASGTESVEFQIATNPGQSLAPLARVVSGGELSRVSLGIQLIAAAKTKFPTLLFDEVDAGIDGETATVVGEKLSRLSARCQVFCITHLAQVACYGRQHYTVGKLNDAGRVSSQLQALSVEQREQEIARMLGGSSTQKESLAHARALLANSD